MRIVHINLERFWRGGERQTLYLMEGLRALGHECSLIARDNEAFIAHARAKGFAVRIIRKPFLVRGGNLSAYDVVHVHETRGLQLAALWKPVHKRPIVATRRVDNMPSRNILTRVMYAQVDRLAAVSGKIRTVMSDWGIRDAEMVVIPDAIETDREISEDAVRVLKKRFSPKKVVGCVAALEKRKDHHTLLKAASLIQDARDDITFVLIGDGGLRPELEKEASRLGLKDVVFEGYREDPYPYYRVFDVFVMPSQQEGLGSSILDAFLYRVPVVATRAGGIPEIVKDRRTGLLADVGDAGMVARSVMTMLDDERLRKACVEEAHAFVLEGFTLDRMAKAYERAYQDVLAHA
jgi:glycosyltransferase involved in cell wall biosynthesis